MSGTLRDRVKEFRRVKASDLHPHPQNWRIHSREQSKALLGMFREVGFSGAVVAYETSGGYLRIIDGHLRAETVKPNDLVPTIILDVTDDEANKLLATFDSIGMMADTGEDALSTLIESINPKDSAFREFIDSLNPSPDGKYPELHTEPQEELDYDDRKSEESQEKESQPSASGRKYVVGGAVDRDTWDKFRKWKKENGIATDSKALSTLIEKLC